MKDRASGASGHALKLPVGMCALESRHGPRATMDRVAAITASRGMTNFARIDHGAGAAEVGLELRPTEVLIFGNARGGTPLMQSAQTIGIDLPLKILVWQDAAGTTWVGYNDPHWLAGRHGITTEQAPVLVTLDEMLAAIAGEAAGESGSTP